MNIYYFRFEAIPTMNAEDFSEYGGALINCWIKEEDKERASIKALSCIKGNGWQIVHLEESCMADDGVYDGKESLKYIDQAKIDGEVYVYHTWPIESQDAGRIH